jgi:hypothetical protein
MLSVGLRLEGQKAAAIEILQQFDWQVRRVTLRVTCCLGFLDVAQQCIFACQGFLMWRSNASLHARVS